MAAYRLPSSDDMRRKALAPWHGSFSRDMTKKYWRPPPGYYDEHRRQAIADVAAKLPALVDNRDEEGYVLILKKWFPEMTPEDLIERIKRFRVAVAEKHGDR